MSDQLAGRSPGDPGRRAGPLLSDVREADTWAGPGHVFAAVSRVGGDRGWPTFKLLWEIRGLLDRVVGGVGLRRGRRDPDLLRVGDVLDFWRVEELETPGEDQRGLLRLRAEMRLPGRAWLEWRIAGSPEGTRLTQRALFAPRGLFGRLYWWAMSPFHPLIFASMVRALAREAEDLARAEGARQAATSSGGPTGPSGGLAEGGAQPDPGPRPSQQAG